MIEKERVKFEHSGKKFVFRICSKKPLAKEGFVVQQKRRGGYNEND
jgi:hypothetical protein